MAYYHYPMTKFNQENHAALNVLKSTESYLFDDRNVRYVDLKSGLWNVSLGYDAEWLSSVEEHVKSVLHDGLFYLDAHAYKTPLYDRYAKSLLTFACEDENRPKAFAKVFYTNSGSESTELALKLSRLARPKETRKKKIVAFSEGYHGTFLGGLQVSGVDQAVAERYEVENPAVVFLPTPKDFISFSAYMETIEAMHEEVGLIIVESVVASGGALTVAKEHLNAIMSFAKTHNIYVVFDEGVTGFYRLGRRFSFTGLEHTPDLVLLSKSINNGFLPFGVVLVSEKMAVDLDDKFVDHFSTQNGNVLGVASAMATLYYMQKKERDILRRVHAFEAIWYRNRTEREMRGEGALIGLPMHSKEQVSAVVSALKEKGYLCCCYGSGVDDDGLLLLPNYLMSETLFEEALKEVIKSMDRFDGGLL
ncbi:aminotransferase class III-fold pyridoxal phosphate-dependent enzyme [Fusibacter sp. JL298sf-3]